MVHRHLLGPELSWDLSELPVCLEVSSGVWLLWESPVWRNSVRSHLRGSRSDSSTYIQPIHTSSPDIEWTLIWLDVAGYLLLNMQQREKLLFYLMALGLSQGRSCFH